MTSSGAWALCTPCASERESRAGWLLLCCSSTMDGWMKLLCMRRRLRFTSEARGSTLVLIIKGLTE